MDVGVKGRVIWEGREGVEGVLVELGRGGVGDMRSSGGSGGGLVKVVEGVRWGDCGSVYLGSSHTHVLFEWEDLSFVVEVVYGCGVCAACCNSECRVLCGLEFLDVCVCYVWVPGWVGVGEDWTDKLFVYLGYMFLGVTISGGGKSSEDVQAGLCFGVNLGRMFPERHSSVIGHSKDGGGWVVGDWAIVECDCWLEGKFAVPGCDEGEVGLGRGDLESVCVEPLFEGVDVLLKVCGSGLGFGVLCEDGEVVCV